MPPSAGRRCRAGRWSSLLRIVVAVLLLPAAPARADPAAVNVRSGNHPDFGRLVFDAPPNARYTLVRDGGTVTIRFAGQIALAEPPAEPRNVSRLRMSGAEAAFSIQAGATIRQMRLGDRIVIDVVDAAAPNAADPPAPPQADPRRRTRPTSRAPTEGAQPSAVTAAAPDAPSARPNAPSSEPAQAAAEAPAGRLNPPAVTSATASALPTPPIPPPLPPLSPNAASPRPASPAQPPTPLTPPPAALPAAAASPSRMPAAPSLQTNRAADHRMSSPAATRSLSAKPAPDARTIEAARIAPAPQVSVQRDSPPAAAPPPPARQPATPPQPPVPQPAATAPAPSEEPPAGPVALMAHRTGTRAADDSGITVPFDRSVGAALFRRGGIAYAVFDERRPIDLAQLRTDSQFAGATAHLLPGATMIRVPVPEDRAVTLQLTARGWRIATASTPPQPQPISPVFTDGQVSFPALAANDVLMIADPDTGATLLVGTQRKPGQGVAAERRTAEFIVVPTVQGVLVEPLSDAVALRTVPTGFVMTGAPPGLAVSPPATMTDGMLAAARLTSHYRFPAMQTDALLRRMTRQISAAAAAPPLARSPARLIVAETMMALGMGAEAAALLQLIAEQDPREAESPDTTGLKAAAALLAGRLAEAAPLADPRLGSTDEDALWRGLLLAARQEGSAEAAALLAATAPLLLRYPPAIRDRLLPLVLETMILAGHTAPAARLLAERKDDPALRLATAMLKQAQGDVDGALAQYDRLANGRDQLTRIRAATRAIELRLASDRLDARQAAAAMEKLLYAWRWDWRDLALRQRLATLRQIAGDWRGALQILREARADFPAQAARIRIQQQETFAALLRDDAADAILPLDLVSLVEENADLLPTTPEGEHLHEQLADRLLALDLPRRAEEVLAGLLKAAPTETSRVGYGTRLAALRLREGDPAGALAALGQSTSLDLSPDQKARRMVLAATAQAKLGNLKAAVGLLTDLDTPAADETRATILEQARDWRGAGQALASLAAKTIPPTGPLDDAQRRTLLRLATAAARAGDGATLADLRRREVGRIGTGPIADMFRLLTADAIRDTEDLKRAQQEIGLVKALPEGLKALRPASGSP